MERACVGKGCAPSLSHWRIAPPAFGPDAEKTRRAAGHREDRHHQVRRGNGIALPWAISMFYFAKAIDSSQPYAFEVKRSEFDAILMKNAVGERRSSSRRPEGAARRISSWVVFNRPCRRSGRAPRRLGSEVRRRCQWPRHISFRTAGRETSERHPQQRGNLRTLRRGDSTARP